MNGVTGYRRALAQSCGVSGRRLTAKTMLVARLTGDELESMNGNIGPVAANEVFRRRGGRQKTLGAEKGGHGEISLGRAEPIGSVHEATAPESSRRVDVEYVPFDQKMAEFAGHRVGECFPRLPAKQAGRAFGPAAALGPEGERAAGTASELLPRPLVRQMKKCPGNGHRDGIVGVEGVEPNPWHSR